MMRLGEIGRRLWALCRRSRLARDVDEEMRLHLALRQERLEQVSGSPSDAAAAARRRFGNPLRLREEAIEAWGWRWLEELTQDVRVTLRLLARHPGFAVTAVSMLALGLGATTAVFSVVSGVVLRPLPFADPDRLVQISGVSPLSPAGGEVLYVDEFRRYSRSFEGIAGSWVTARYLRQAEAPERVMTVQAEPAFFSILGVPALRGRTFGPQDLPDVAVISENFWTTHLGRDPSAVGRVLSLDDQAYTILGVMPGSFQFPYRAASALAGVAADERTDVWIPLDPPLAPHHQIGNVIGRLRPNVSVSVAQRELAAIAAHAEAQDAGNQRRDVQIVPLSDAVVSAAVRRPLFLLFGAVWLLLVLACSNVANVLLVRVTLRSREIALRQALGAGRLRLARQFLTESLLLSCAAGLAGLGLAWWAMKYMIRIAGAHIPRAHEVGLDWRVFLFLLALCTVIGIALTLAPVLTSGRKDPRSVLQESGDRSTGGAASRRLRDGLIVAEVALAYVLGVGAAMLVREWVRLRDTNSGMVTTDVMTFHVGHRMTGRDDVSQFYEIAHRVERLPQVRAAGFTQVLPLQNWGWASNSIAFMRAFGRSPEVFPVELRFVTPGYFRALGIPVRGRAFTDADNASAPPVIMINEALARRVFPSENPIGTVGRGGGTIVGIVGDVHQVNLDRPSAPELYTAMAQNWSQISELGLTLVVSTRGQSNQVVEPVRTIVHDVNPHLAVFRIQTMDAVVADSLSDFTMYLDLMAVAAGLALVLVLTGLYAVISRVAAARTRECAIRMALGADRARVLRLILGHAVRLTGIGLGAGMLAAVAGGRVVQGLAVSVRPPDAVTVAPTAIFIGAMAIVACLVPAWRAAAADPIEALRRE